MRYGSVEQVAEKSQKKRMPSDKVGTFGRFAPFWTQGVAE
jgi:hypothetical protein